MATEEPSSLRDQTRARSDRLCESLSTRPTLEAAAEAALLLLSLRDLREFDRLCAVADLVCRLSPDDAKARRLYAQGPHRNGTPHRSGGHAQGSEAALRRRNAEYAEFERLLGRAYKQRFMDTVDPQGTWASSFIKRSFAEYGGAYARDPAKNFWHGINLGALAHVASLRGVALDG
jgi:hypothetical protein